MLSATCKPFMLSAIKLNVIMLSVVAPTKTLDVIVFKWGYVIASQIFENLTFISIRCLAQKYFNTLIFSLLKII